MPRIETPESLVRKIEKTTGFSVEKKTSGLGWMASNDARRAQDQINPQSQGGGWRTGIGTHFSDRAAFDNCLARLRKIGWSHKVYQESVHADHEQRLDKARAEDATVANNLFADWSEPAPEPEQHEVRAPHKTSDLLTVLAGGGGENVYDLSTFEQLKIQARLIGREEALGWVGDLPDYQRNRSRTAERTYAEIMLRGEWILHPHGLLFDPDGKCLDGQSRLGALLWATDPTNEDHRAGLRVPFIVFENVPVAAYAATDQGRKRSLTHLMQSLQEPDPTQFQATLRMLYLYDHVPQSEWAARRAQLSNARALAFREKEGEAIRQSLYWKKLRTAKFNATSITTAHAVLSRRYPNDAVVIRRWFERLAYGFGLTEGDPTAALRTYVMTEGEGDERSRLNLGDKKQFQFALILRAWVNALNGKSLMRLSPRRDMICPHDLPDIPTGRARSYLPSGDEPLRRTA
ncbi:hypothetical protein [Streptomyces sp. NPDC057302]|uniref:hypothetical protein n=1 Tax=Streptomyces sp. NPDC057302 TaxID=3346094 RepID=UPI00363423B7